jgi:chromosome partitioning protein
MNQEPKIITLFNHKGGVSKTTTTFHLGWKLAKQGKRVLIVDADPQCNLTGLTLGIDDYDSLFKFYDSRQNGNIYESVKSIFEGEESDPKPATITPTKNPNLFLLAGHIKLSEADIQIATATTSSGSLPILKKFIGVFYNLFIQTAKKNDIDIILVDMSPSVSALNMTLLMGSHYFIIPTSPDFFCYQAIDSLGEVFSIWSDKMRPFKDGIRLPKDNPKLIGTISQNYRVYTPQGFGKEDQFEPNPKEKVMAKSFRNWSEKIESATKSVLIPKLDVENMVIKEENFKKIVSSKVPYNLASIQDFNSLMPISQLHSIPIFEIKQENTGFSGASWNVAENNIKIADSIYTELAKNVIGLIS